MEQSVQEQYTVDELIAIMKMLKAEIEWEHSLEYQLALDAVIEILKGEA